MKELNLAKKRRELVTKKNSILGQEAVEQILSKYPMPVNRLHINDTVFICVEKAYHFKMRGEQHFLRFVISKKTDDSIEYSTLLGTNDTSYKIYSEGLENNSCDWERLGISQSAMADIPRLINEL